jgi:hypothetical protein
MAYMLLMRGDPAAFIALPAAQQQQVVAAHTAWAEQLAHAGKLLHGGGFSEQFVRLAREGAEVSQRQLSALGDPLAISGFYIVEAASADEATALARQCPALGHGEMVDVLQVAF